MSYTLKDMKEAAIGAFSTVLLFFAIRQGDPVGIDPFVGAVIGGAWLLLLYTANNKDKEAFNHFTGNLAIVILLTGILTLAFKMGTTESLLSWSYFGSAAWISVWIGMPVAILFDLNNFTNVLSRYYVHRRKR